MASVGVRVERPVRLGRGVEERFDWHYLHLWAQLGTLVCAIGRSVRMKRT